MKRGITLLLMQLTNLFRRIFGSPSAGDSPNAGVRVPTKRGPGGRRSAIAVMEPGEDDGVTAFGRSMR
jgi:hypothetical protein